ncbi:hypothetical protein [uncultured Clostridium sp.]|uniref:hypothetical protein n=1 Tax=uncultured Clostridium sp. TaxID=59620 RepID=UPI00260BA571|nr:hypothetical protein [uncultured Clostridium sp.]
MTKKTYNPEYDKKVYQYNKKNENITKRYLDYNGKEYPINCGYKAIKKLTKVIKNLKNEEDEIETIEGLLVEIIGKKAFDEIVDDDFEYVDFIDLFKTIMGIVQGVEPEDMEEFFRGFDEQ